MDSQDIGVLLPYYLGYSRIRNMFLRLKRRPVARFVRFHDISPEALGCFRANLHFLKRNTNVMSLDDFFSGRLSPEKINTVITFDDGYKSWAADAVPILQELGLPATFFVSSGLVGLSKEEEAEFAQSKLFLKLRTDRDIVKSGLNSEDLRGIAEKGFIVGGHTLNHCNLEEVRDSVRLRYEIAEDKMRLERMIGRKIEYFAYPFGAYRNPVTDLAGMLKELGYRGAVTTVPGFNSIGTDPYLLHREFTDAATPRQVFRARVYGNYDAVQFLKKKFSAILHRR